MDRFMQSALLHLNKENFSMKRLVVAATLLFAPLAAHADYLDLSNWSAEGNGQWDVGADGNSVSQGVNGHPTLFYSDANSIGKQFSANVTVSGNDDDFIGFVLGYNSGEANSAESDFILIDWKKRTQTNSQYGTAAAGLSVSHVTQGLGYDDSSWGHAASKGVEELARGVNFGESGWEYGETYKFDITYTDTLLEIFINGVKEISLTGNFTDGAFGFYNFSQAGAAYSQISAQSFYAQNSVPTPATALLFGAGLVGMARLRRKKQ